MGQIRKSYTAALKAKVVQEALAGEKTLSQIASTYGIHANMITKWKQIADQAMPETLENEGERQSKSVVSKTSMNEKKKSYMQKLAGNHSGSLVAKKNCRRMSREIKGESL